MNIDLPPGSWPHMERDPTFHAPVLTGGGRMKAHRAMLIGLMPVSERALRSGGDAGKPAAPAAAAARNADRVFADAEVRIRDLEQQVQRLQTEAGQLRYAAVGSGGPAGCWAVARDGEPFTMFLCVAVTGTGPLGWAVSGAQNVTGAVSQQAAINGNRVTVPLGAIGAIELTVDASGMVASGTWFGPGGQVHVNARRLLSGN